MNTQGPAFRILNMLDPEDRRAELRRLIEIRRYADVDGRSARREAMAEIARRDRIAPEVVAAFMALRSYAELSIEFNLSKNWVERIVRANTTSEQRRSVRHKRKCRRREPKRPKPPVASICKPIEVDGVTYPSLAAACRATGINRNTATYRVKVGIPLEVAVR